jgi:hypothetical protein
MLINLRMLAQTAIIRVGEYQTSKDTSRVKITLQNEAWHCHRPHPGKEAKRYQVEEAREMLERLGIKP